MKYRVGYLVKVTKPLLQIYMKYKGCKFVIIDISTHIFNRSTLYDSADYGGYFEDEIEVAIPCTYITPKTLKIV